MPNGRCRMHGGPTPRGIASPHFKHGKDSRYLQHLPAALALHFDPDSPHLIQLGEELALLKAGIGAALQQLQASKRPSAKMQHAMWDLVDRLGRLIAIESRRRKDEHEMVERSDFARFAKAVLLSVATHVDDPKIRGKIQEDALRVLAISQVPLIEAAAS